MLARVERLAAVLRKWLLCAIRRDGLASALAIGASTLLHTVASGSSGCMGGFHIATSSAHRALPTSLPVRVRVRVRVS